MNIIVVGLTLRDRTSNGTGKLRAGYFAWRYGVRSYVGCVASVGGGSGAAVDRTGKLRVGDFAWRCGVRSYVGCVGGGNGAAVDGSNEWCVGGVASVGGGKGAVV